MADYDVKTIKVPQWCIELNGQWFDLSSFKAILNNFHDTEPVYCEFSISVEGLAAALEAQGIAIKTASGNYVKGPKWQDAMDRLGLKVEHENCFCLDYPSEEPEATATGEGA